jgi:hypothetical protein
MAAYIAFAVTVYNIGEFVFLVKMVGSIERCFSEGPDQERMPAGWLKNFVRSFIIGYFGLIIERMQYNDKILHLSTIAVIFFNYLPD